MNKREVIGNWNSEQKITLKSAFKEYVKNKRAPKKKNQSCS